MKTKIYKVLEENKINFTEKRPAQKEAEYTPFFSLDDAKEYCIKVKGKGIIEYEVTLHEC